MADIGARSYRLLAPQMDADDLVSVDFTSDSIGQHSDLYVSAHPQILCDLVMLVSEDGKTVSRPISPEFSYSRTMRQFKIPFEYKMVRFQKMIGAINGAFALYEDCSG